MQGGGDPEARLSILIPVLDEARLLPGLLDHLRGEAAVHDVIVVDGGSRDATAAIARDHPLRPTMLIAAGGRHAQLNAGLAAARGRYVLVLPADLRLPAGAIGRLIAELARVPAPAGCLRRIAADRRRLFRWLDGWSAVRARWNRGAYADQAPFFDRLAALRAGGFRAVGGYDTADLGRRLCHRRAFLVASVPIVISCRAYHRRGFIRLTYDHQRIRIRHLLGRPPRGRQAQPPARPEPHRHFVSVISAQTYPSGSATNASVPQS